MSVNTPYRRPAVVALFSALVGALIGLVAFLAPAPGIGPSVDSGAPFSANGGVDSSYGNLPLAFQPSAGRYEGVDFLADSGSGSVAVGPGGILFSQGYGSADEPASAAIALTLPGATLADGEATGRLPGVVHDLRGNDPARHVTDIPTFSSVVYPDVWPGIDLQLRGNAANPEYDFIVAPGADPSLVSVEIDGSESVRLTAAGDLRIRSGGATFTQKAPVSFQPAATGRDRVPVESAFLLDGNRVSFELGAYDPRRPLVIDPLVLSYSTYLGGNGEDQLRDVAVDASGSAYVTGWTGSTDFDTVGPIEVDADGGGSVGFDAVISKLNPAGNALVYSTYLGGGGNDRGNAIAIDGSGAAYVAGVTGSVDFNTVDPYEEDVDGAGADSDDVFVAKLNPAGNALVYSTYIGGNDDDRGNDIAIDASGAAYVTGLTESADYDTVGQIEGDSAGDDVFVSKLNPAGNALVYSTYIGGDGDDEAYGIALDSTGSAYVTGITGSTDFDTVGQIEGDSIADDVFVSKLNPAGSALTYSTYLGGDDLDQGLGIATDSTGAAYITGYTLSTDFDTVGPIEGASPGLDAFVSKLNPAGSGLAYSTYLGGSGTDGGTGIAVGTDGAAHVVGSTDSTDFDTVDPAQGDSPLTDAFVSKLTPAGSALTWSTYLGGDGAFEVAHGVALDSAGDVYVVGATQSSDFPTVGEIEGDSPNVDGFVTKLFFGDTEPPDTLITAGPPPNSQITDRTPSFGFESTEAGSTFECSLVIQGSPAAFGACSGPGATHTPANKLRRKGQEFQVRAIDSDGNVDPTPASLKFKVVKRLPKCLGKRATIKTTGKDDVITGTPGRDIIKSQGGDDVIDGVGGNDLLCGGKGDDIIDGGEGNDRLQGGVEKKKGKRKGKAGDKDILRGGEGNDTLLGFDGSEDLYGGPGRDKLFGGDGKDRLFGEEGNDNLKGGKGKDRLDGGPDKDKCNGGKQKDRAKNCEKKIAI